MGRLFRGLRGGLAGERKRRYDKYIDSSLWRSRRAAWVAVERERVGSRIVCVVCRGEWVFGSDDLHHVDYTRLGAERHHDLVPVHRVAHDQIHALIDGFHLTRRVPLRLANRHAISILRRKKQFNCALRAA